MLKKKIYVKRSLRMKIYLVYNVLQELSYGLPVYLLGWVGQE